jgi:glycosidase
MTLRSIPLIRLAALCTGWLLSAITSFGAPGVVWHEPAYAHPDLGGPTMRAPLYEVAGNDITVYQGFWKNGGANGDQNGGEVRYRFIPRGGSPGPWTSLNLSFHSNVGGNQFWKATLPTSAAGPTHIIEYYIKVTFTPGLGSDPETTFIHGGDLQGLSLATTHESAAQAAPFSIRNRPGWIFHGNNRIVAGDDLQVRVKTGYIGPDNSQDSRWATAGAVYFTTDGSAPIGSLGVASGPATGVVPLVYDGTEGDPSANGNAVWWRATMAGVLDGLNLGDQVRYRIGLWSPETQEEKFADHSAGTDNATFVYQNGVIGDPVLTINGLNANYTTTKLFVDEIAGESHPLQVVFEPGQPGITAAEVFTNLNRRDRAEADANGDGYPDGISGIAGNDLTAGDDGHYYKAYPMTSDGPGRYVLTLPASRTGAYRLTARWKVDGDPVWRWYTNPAANRRDHAITVSPQDARDIVLYEINVLNIEAVDDTFGGRSTIEDMHNAFGAPHNLNNRWDLDYLKSLGANWLWFQPIHPAARAGREPFGGWGSGNPPYEPGSPYAVKNFFEVSPIMTKDFAGSPFNDADLLSPANRAAAMNAWKNFVAAADGKEVGIMLDAPFNHTAFDVELAGAGVELLQPHGASWSETDEIRSREARFFSRVNAYDQRASDADSIAPGPDRFDFGKWNDVKDVFFGVYSSLVPNESQSGKHLNEADQFNFTHPTWTSVDFHQGPDSTEPRNVTRQVWRYFARYGTHWLEKTRPEGENRNSETEPGLTTAERYQWDARGIDGLRCDFGQGLPPQAWEYIINVARSHKWNFVMMSESLDGGAVTYRSNRHFDILNENIVFPLASATTAGDYRNIFETRRNAYGQGLVLINNVSHDEKNYSDPWEALIRYSVAGSIDGVPMIFPGQELGISETFGYNHYELNFGKLIPHFKRFNSMQPVWNDTNFGNDQLYPVFAGIGAARSASPALRSSNRWFLDGDGFENRIHAVAKYQTPEAPPGVSDVVLAFANLDRNNDRQDNFRIPGTLATRLGIKDGRIYQARNIAAYENPAIGMSNRRTAWVWPGSGYTGAQLKNDGFLVVLKKVPTAGISPDPGVAAWNQHPFEAQYLKLYDVTPPPAPGTPAAQDSLFATVTGDGVTFVWSGAADPDGGVSAYRLQVGTSPGASDLFDAVLDGSSHSLSGLAFGTVVYARVAQINNAGIEGNFSNSSTAVVLLDPAGDADGDGQSNSAEHQAGTHPMDPSSVLRVTLIQLAGQDVEVKVATVPGKIYQLESSTNLAPPWQALGEPVTAPGAETTLVHPAGAGAGRRFYRARVMAE